MKEQKDNLKTCDKMVCFVSAKNNMKQIKTGQHFAVSYNVSL